MSQNIGKLNSNFVSAGSDLTVIQYQRSGQGSVRVSVNAGSGCQGGESPYDSRNKDLSTCYKTLVSCSIFLFSINCL